MQCEVVAYNTDRDNLNSKYLVSRVIGFPMHYSHSQLLFFTCDHGFRI